MGKIHIGTSGWQYKHWKGTFYPEELPQKEQFAFYQRHFNTVELNSSFYHLPSEKTFANWRQAVKDDFLFVVKASKYITHMKKLHDAQESLGLLLRHAAALKEKLGPFLFQLPPGWEVNVERLASFVRILPPEYRYAFEFRNHTWYDERVYDVLKTHNCAFCIYELDKHLSPLVVTADFVYLRLHGPDGKYQGSYTDKILAQWATKCREWQSENKEVFVYFDNDQQGFAAFNALRLKEMVKKE